MAKENMKVNTAPAEDTSVGSAEDVDYEVHDDEKQSYIILAF